jgi:hypothetical protein
MKLFYAKLILWILIIGWTGGIGMTGVFVEENFKDWAQIDFTEEGALVETGWRLFSVNGAEGRFEIFNTHQESFIRISRGAAAGDSALDRDLEQLRPLVQPETSVILRVWARKVEGEAKLNLGLAEYEGNAFTGKSRSEIFELSEQFTPYFIETTTTSPATELNPAVRISGTGSIEVARIELFQKESAAGGKPQIMLPQGRTPNSTPTLWWRGPTGQAVQVQTSLEMGFQNLLWDSGELLRATEHWLLPEQQPGQPVYARVRIQDFEQVWSEWSEPTLIVYTPMEQLAPTELVVYNLHSTRNMDPARAFEQAHFVSVLQGIVNRERPRLYLKWLDADDFWLDRLREPGRWMEHVTVRQIDNDKTGLEQLVDIFRDDFEGVVLWDPDVPATSNVASTVGGIENLAPIPLREEHGSLYQRLVTGGPRLEVKRSLVDLFTGQGVIPETKEPSSGSAKNDAYRWAVQKYVKSGLSDPARLGYYIDAWWIQNPHGDYSLHTLTNHDFFVQHQGFLWDLNVWNDETPVDDPGQPMGTDYETLLRLLYSCHERLGPQEMIHCAGFTPWAFKYTTYGSAGGTHGAVPTEWETVRLLSAFDAVLDADAIGLCGLANASVWWHMPRPMQFNQPPPPSYEECRRQGWIDAEGQVAPLTYLLHYVGDYDAAAWLTTEVPPYWNDFRRGEVMLPWAWNPNLMERGAPMFDEFVRTRTAYDRLWAGDNGAGYLNPTQLFPPRDPSGLPDGSERWIAYCRKFFRKLDYRHVGFVIQGRAGGMTDEARAMYSRFAADGIVEQPIVGAAADRLFGRMPILDMSHNGIGDIDAGVRDIRNLATPGATDFLVIRSVLHPSSYYWEVNRALWRQYPEIDMEEMGPQEFFYLLRHHLGGGNDRRAAFLFDSLPDKVTAGSKVTVSLWIRNIGWETWSGAAKEGVQVGVELTCSDRRENPVKAFFPQVLAPGQMGRVDFELEAPQEPGEYYFRADLVASDGQWFEEAGNLPLFRKVKVVDSCSK